MVSEKIKVRLIFRVFMEPRRARGWREEGNFETISKLISIKT